MKPLSDKQKELIVSILVKEYKKGKRRIKLLYSKHFQMASFIVDGFEWLKKEGVINILHIQKNWVDSPYIIFIKDPEKLISISQEPNLNDSLQMEPEYYPQLKEILEIAKKEKKCIFWRCAICGTPIRKIESFEQLVQLSKNYKEKGAEEKCKNNHLNTFYINSSGLSFSSRWDLNNDIKDFSFNRKKIVKNWFRPLTNKNK